MEVVIAPRGTLGPRATRTPTLQGYLRGCIRP